MPNWYSDSFLLLHYDHPYSDREHPPAATGLDPEQVARLLRRTRPDVVQYTAKGPSGSVPYPTRYGNQLHGVWPEHPEVLQVYREVTRELGIRLVLGYHGLVDQHAAEMRPDWMRVTYSAVPYPNRALCPNSGYVEELLLPHLAELIERYEPDGIWLDGDNWSVSPCYCSACENEYQMIVTRPSPMGRDDPWWSRWLEFHRESFDRYLTRTARFLEERAPGVVLASNGAYATHQPEPPAPGPERLTWDLSPAFSLRQAGLEGRFFSSREIPFDLATWTRCSARPWPQGKLPALPIYPKSRDHLRQEAAVILANGGRWSVWMGVYPDDSLPETEHETVGQVFEWARERQPWCTESRSAAYVAVLHSEQTHRRAGNGLFDPGPSLDRVRGAHQMLLELHHPHDLVNEEALRRNLDRYRVVILPEQVGLSAEIEQALTEWVRGGGRLIASGRVAPQIIEDIPTFAFEEVLGVRWTGRRDLEGVMLHRGTPLRIAAPTYQVAVPEAEVVRPLLVSARETAMQDTGYPGVTRNEYGEGEGYYLAAEIFAAYHRSQYFGLREVLGDVLSLALPTPPLLTTAGPEVEIAMRERPGQTVVHCVNHSPGKSLAQNNAWVETVPPTEPFSLTLALAAEPAAVRLQPGEREVEWSYAGGTLTAFVPPFHLHEMLVVEHAPVEEPAPEESVSDNEVVEEYPGD
ncbi:MAG: beta-galactosidase trimerization domain-containing protein [Armatimonadota bacterium]